MLISWICLFGLLAGVRSSENSAELQKFIGIIYNSNTPVCIGATVGADAQKTKFTMVTAAHCVRKASNLIVSLGNQTAEINQMMIHPFYKPPLYDYDIAVLKIKFKNPISTLNPILLLDKENEIPKTLHVTQTSQINQLVTGVQVAIEERQACQSKHGSKIRISTKMICAQSGSTVLGGSALYYEKKKLFAPTIPEYLLVGVASYSLNSSLPIIFTNIANSQIYQFIDQYI